MDVKLTNKNHGPDAIKILNEDVIRKLKKIVLDCWKNRLNGKDFFPAPQPVSLERSNLYKLIDYDYVVCAKSDGMRFLLMYNDGVSYVVDRAFNFFQIKMSFKDGFTEGIFDGELIYTKKKVWKYVIHDCISMNGKDVSGNNFSVRYAHAENLVDNVWDKNAISSFNLSKKLFFSFKNIKLLDNLIKEGKLDHDVDGIIFTPENKRIGAHTQYDLFKWKPLHLHTFDFKITRNDQGIIAFVNKSGNHIAYAKASRGSDDEKLFIESLEKNCPGFKDNQIVECEYRDGTYIPIKIRHDKTHPNSLFTVMKTIENIAENITMEELISLVP